MLSFSNFRPLFRSYGTDFDVKVAAPDANAANRDPLLRYSVLGIFLIVAIACLSIAKVIAVPIVSGLVFGIVLGPVADRMARFMPQSFAAALVVLAGIAAMTALGTILAAPLANWSNQAPAMLEALRSRSQDFFEMLDRFENVLRSLALGPSASPPPQVVVHDNQAMVAVALTSGSLAGGLLLFIGTVYFYLATQRSIKAHALRICLGRSARHLAGQFFEKLEQRIAYYFGIVSLINLGLGCITGVIAWMAGLPYPIFWVAFAALMNFMAFVGPLIVTLSLFAAALLGAPSFSSAVLPAAAFLLIHGIESQIVTPGMIGKRLTISPILVFLSIAFWLWLWGPIGALLATPVLLIISVFQEVTGQQKLADANETAQEDEELVEEDADQAVPAN